MRNIDPEQHYNDEREARLFAWDNDDADICGPDEYDCEICGDPITDDNCSTEDVVCKECLPTFCRQLRAQH